MDNVISLIEEKKPGLSKSHKKIAEHILKNIDKSAYMTAAKLAEKTGVSEATVVRFATTLGFDGYPEFEKSLICVARTQLTSVQRMELANEKLGSRDVLSSILKADISYIEKTLERIDKTQFEKIVDALSGANRVYIMGMRSSAALAEFAGFYLNLIFDNVHLIKAGGGDDLLEQILSIGENDVFIGISFPRYSNNTINALKYAKKNGATVVGITDSANSPLAENSELKLIAESDTMSFVDSLTAPFSVINALIVAVGMKNKSKVQKNLEKLEQIWDEYEVYN